MSKSPNFRERALFLVSPRRGNEAYQERLAREQRTSAGNSQEKRGGPRMATSYYGRHGASTTLNSMIGWLVGGGAAEDDIDVHGATLRKRARDLYAGGGLARSGPNTLVTNVVGWGIMPKPKIDSDLLGMSDEARDEWERNTLREFRLWAENVMCDAGRQLDFYGMQRLAFLSKLMSGDVFALFGMKENKRTPYQLTIRIIEADRVATPESNGESTSQTTDSGGRIIDGVELDKEGAVIRYYITSRHPLAEEDNSELIYTPIDAFGSDTGMPNILHVMTHERPEQRRGVPFVAAIIELLKQFDRYINSELAANLVSAMLTAFITNTEDGSQNGLEHSVDDEERVTDDELHLELRPGAIYDLPPGKKIEHINPLRANSAFESFVTALETIIGSSIDIPKEVLLHKYDSNYTAARSALLDFWRTVRVHRAGFNASFNQPIYEAWLSEAVATGRIEAPGFFEDPAIRQAWCGCMWMGVSMGHVDPKKEVEAAILRIQAHLSTEEQEAREYNGNDWNEIIRQRQKEIEAMADYQESSMDVPDTSVDDETKKEDDDDE
ncbi:MAG: phage portal protein [Succinivibrionaceae bacterium]|nr:phage portal protein [Succinivibrionaceae bacterium]